MAVEVECKYEMKTDMAGWIQRKKVFDVNGTDMQYASNMVREALEDMPNIKNLKIVNCRVVR